MWEEEKEHPGIPALHPPLVTFYVAPLAVFATVAVGVASHVHVLETGIRGRPGSCRKEPVWDEGSSQQGEMLKLGAAAGCSQGKHHGEVSWRVLQVLDQEQHKRGEIPFSLGFSRGFWPWGGIHLCDCCKSARGTPSMLALGVTAPGGTPSPPHQPPGHRPQPLVGTAQPLHPLSSGPRGRGHGLDTTLRHNIAPERGDKEADGTDLVPRAGHTADGGSCTCRCCSKPRRRHRLSHPAGTRWLGRKARHPCSTQGGHKIPLLPCRLSQPP